MDKRAAADFLDGILREQKIEKYSYFLNQSEKQELNLENGGFKLMRTVFNNTTSVKVFNGTKMGSAGGNDMTEAGLRCIPGTMPLSDPEEAAKAVLLMKDMPLYVTGAVLKVDGGWI